MQDVADAAGVSKSTVSFILNGRDDLRISEQTKTKVWQVINMLNYRPNLYAKNLRGTQRNKVIAFYMSQSLSDLEKHRFYQFFDTAANILLESGQRAQLLLELARLDNVDAIVGWNLPKATFMALAESNFIPVIAGDCVVADPLFYEVGLDYARLKTVADAALPEGYAYVCSRPGDEQVAKAIREVFPRAEFVSSYEGLSRLQVEAAFVTEPLLQEYYASRGTAVFYPHGLLQRQLRRLLDCVTLAVSHESREQHTYAIY